MKDGRTQKESTPLGSAGPDTTLVAGILFLTFLAFFPTLKSGYIFLDDPEYILNNPFSRSFNLKEMFSSYYMGNYHPLTLLSHALEYKVFGLNLFMIHLDNLILHLANTFLVYLFVFRLFKKDYPLIAPIAAVFFGIHPMHVESVAWLSERKDVLHGFFYLLALLSYLHYLQKEKTTRWLIITFFLSLLAMLAKGQAVSLPFIFVLLDYFTNSSEKSLISKQDLLAKVPFFLLAAIFGYVAIEAQKASGSINQTLNDGNIIYGFYALCMYIFKFFIPVQLAGIHPYPQAQDLSVPNHVYLGLLVIPLILYVLLKTVKKKKVVFFGMMFFLVSIAPMLKFVPVGDTIMAERYTYLPYLGLFIILGYGLELISRRYKNYSRIFRVVLVMVVLHFSYLTFSYTKVFKDNFSYWTNVANHYPDSWRANHSLGRHYYDTREYDKAVVYFTRAIERDKTCPPFPYLWRGITNLEKLNKPMEAIADLETVAGLNDGTNDVYREGLYYLSLARYRSGAYDSALMVLDKLLPYAKNSSKLHNLCGLILAAKRNFPEAVAEYSRSIELNPEFAEPLFNRGKLYLEQSGEYDKAMDDFKRVLGLQPDNTEAAIHLGISLIKKGEFDEAIRHFSAVIAKHPNLPEAYYQRSRAYLSKKEAFNAQKDEVQAMKLGLKISDKTPMNGD